MVKNVNGQKREGSGTGTGERNRKGNDKEQTETETIRKVNCFEWKECILSNKSKSLKKCLGM